MCVIYSEEEIKQILRYGLPSEVPRKVLQAILKNKDEITSKWYTQIEVDQGWLVTVVGITYEKGVEYHILKPFTPEGGV